MKEEELTSACEHDGQWSESGEEARWRKPKLDTLPSSSNTWNTKTCAPWLSWLQRPTVSFASASKQSEGREFEPHWGSSVYEFLFLFSFFFFKFLGLSVLDNNPITFISKKWAKKVFVRKPYILLSYKSNNIIVKDRTTVYKFQIRRKAHYESKQ